MVASPQTESPQGFPSEPDNVYDVLGSYQIESDWAYRDVARELHRWAEIIDLEFKLQVPELTLRLDRLHCRRLGHFRSGENGFGLRGEVAINTRYLQKGEFWDLIGTLAHELIHAWQQAYGRPGRRNYHNVAFRRRASEIGLIVDDRGHTTYDPNGAFFELLRRHGVVVPNLPEPVPAEAQTRGTSKLKLWTCGCTRARVAVAEFRARCLKCDRMFCRVD